MNKESKAGLKLYLQKELQSKKYLQDAHDYVAQIDSLEQQEKDLTKNIHSLLHDNERLSKQKDKLTDDIKSAEIKIKQNNARADKVLSDADIKYDEKVKAGELEADRIKQDAQDDADAAAEELKAVKSSIAALKLEQTELTNSVDALKQEKARILKQYG